MKTPYCIIDGKKYQLEWRDCLRFPDDGRPDVDLNEMVIDYIKGRVRLDKLLDYYVNSGTSYELVYSNFSVNGMNNHTVTQGPEKAKKFKLYLGKSLKQNP